MPWKIALVGGDEFRSGCEEMDRLILRETPSQPARVLIVPTAATPENPQAAARNGVRYFMRLGANASDLMVLDSDHANDEALVGTVLGTSVIYFTGGSPSYLLSVLERSKFLHGLKVALEKGAILAGSSAGAMVMGSLMRSPSQGWGQGLGIVEGVAILPHHERSDPDRVARELTGAVPKDLKVLGIDGKTCCFGSRDDWRVLGQGKVTLYAGGAWTSFGPGETLPKGF